MFYANTFHFPISHHLMNALPLMYQPVSRTFYRLVLSSFCFMSAFSLQLSFQVSCQVNIVYFWTTSRNTRVYKSIFQWSIQMDHICAHMPCYILSILKVQWTKGISGCWYTGKIQQGNFTQSWATPPVPCLHL